MIQIKHWVTGSVRFEAEVASVKLAVELAVKQGANLSGADLRWADLSGTDLRWADLSGTNLRWADLRRADLSGANLRQTDLIGANLRQTDLSGADLRRADLRRANLSGANLDTAKGICSAGPCSDGFIFYFHPGPDGVRIKAGCRWFSIKEAEYHYRAQGTKDRLGDIIAERRAVLSFIRATSKARGWNREKQED